jgi:hypothetical protein
LCVHTCTAPHAPCPSPHAAAQAAAAGCTGTGGAYPLRAAVAVDADEAAAAAGGAAAEGADAAAAYVLLYRGGDGAGGVVQSRPGLPVSGNVGADEMEYFEVRLSFNFNTYSHMFTCAVDTCGVCCQAAERVLCADQPAMRFASFGSMFICAGAARRRQEHARGRQRLRLGRLHRSLPGAAAAQRPRPRRRRQRECALMPVTCDSCASAWLRGAQHVHERHPLGGVRTRVTESRF